MDPKVEKFLEYSQSELEKCCRQNAELQQKQESERRDALLIELGLCEREEAEKISADEHDWRWDAQKAVYYRYRALTLTEEEYEKVAEASARLTQAREAQRALRPARRREGLFSGLVAPSTAPKPLFGNRLAVVFRVLSWVMFILGVNLGIIVGAQAKAAPPATDGFDVIRMIFVWVAFFVIGMLFYAVSEALALLQKHANERDGQPPER